MLRTKRVLCCAIFALGSTCASELEPLAEGGAVLAKYANNGNIITLGVNDAGHLDFFSTGPQTPTTPYWYGMGIVTGNPNVSPPINGVIESGGAAPGDATAAGCQCEGWGVSFVSSTGASLAGFANVSGGSGGLASGGVAGAGGYGAFGHVLNPNDTTNFYYPTTFSSLVQITNDVDAGTGVFVQQVYGPSLSADIWQDQVTITNRSGGAISDVLYRRAMDWDIPPDTFFEYVTHSGVNANLGATPGVFRASDNGFASSDPRVDPGYVFDPGSVNQDFTRSGPADHGSVFDFQFGSLDDGESATFNVYYGATTSTFDGLGSVTATATQNALTQLNAIHADVYSLGQWGYGDANGDPVTYIFAFNGVAGVEPGSSPDAPLIPFVPAPYTYYFPSPPPRSWFDPPFSDTMDFSLATGTFTGIDWEAIFGSGSIYGCPTWSSCVLLGVHTGSGGATPFDLSGWTYSMLRLILAGATFDAGDPLGFPTYLDFTPGATGLTMAPLISVSSVPEPVTQALVGLGFAGIFVIRRRRSRR